MSMKPIPKAILIIAAVGAIGYGFTKIDLSRFKSEEVVQTNTTPPVIVSPPAVVAPPAPSQAVAPPPVAEPSQAKTEPLLIPANGGGIGAVLRQGSK